MDIRSAYESTAGLIEDDAQSCVVEKLGELQQCFVNPVRRRHWSASIFRSLNSRPAVAGLYLWGGVGRGKTFLMDLFFETLAIEDKKRVHFHRMMSDVHARIQSVSGTEDPVDVVADSIATQLRVLCFDEFFVSDIGDAMILGRLLDGLFRRNVTLVTTSNSPPNDLYHDGLQRERFLPAIKLLETNTNVVQLDAGTDYRLRMLQKAGTFFCESEVDGVEHLSKYFEQIATGSIQKNRDIDILGRPIPSIRKAKGVAWFDFFDICGGPRSQNDYIEIARSYQTVLISNIPTITAERDDPARRFIALVDEFYDRHVKLILSCATDVDSMYSGTRLRFEFERTKSRLIEMQSEKYLHSAHLS